MSFQMPGENGFQESAQKPKVRFTGKQIAFIVVGVLCIVLAIIFLLAGQPLGSSNQGDNYGSGFLATFPDYGRLILLFLGMALAVKGLFWKRKNRN